MRCNLQRGGSSVKSLSKANLPFPVIETRRRVDSWRRTRPKRGAMPRALWEEAANLARIHGINPIARALGLEYYALKGHLEGAGARTAVSRPGFVEVAVCAPPPSPERVVEVERADGARMRVRLSNQEDLMAVTASFWGCRP
jgi:hypothetical protein